MLKFLFLVLMLVTLSGCAGSQSTISFEDSNEYEEVPVSGEAVSLEEPEAEDIYVAVMGYVAEPGVYVVPKGSRVYEVINAAGGVSEGGNPEALNLVGILEDGSTIYVPSEASYEGEAVIYGPTEPDDGLININTASVNELKTLKGIGDTRASAIVEYREAHGKFNSVEDIKNVSGIKDGTFEAIKDSITAR